MITFNNIVQHLQIDASKLFQFNISKGAEYNCARGLYYYFNENDLHKTEFSLSLAYVSSQTYINQQIKSIITYCYGSFMYYRYMNEDENKMEFGIKLLHQANYEYSYLELGKIYYELHEYNMALYFLHKCIHNMSLNMSHYYIGSIYYIQSDAKNALSYYLKFIQNENDYTNIDVKNAIFNIAIIYYHLKMYAYSLTYFDKLDNDPEVEEYKHKLYKLLI